VTLSAGSNEVATVSIVVTGRGTMVPFDPANNRVFVFARQASTVVGATSVAVRTP
jgi:hypothetical protein